VAHVETAGYIGRRQEQGEDGARLARWRSLDVEKFFFDPVLGPARLNGARFVSFGQFVRHECRYRGPAIGIRSENTCLFLKSAEEPRDDRAERWRLSAES